MARSRLHGDCRLRIPGGSPARRDGGLGDLPILEMKARLDKVADRALREYDLVKLEPDATPNTPQD